MARPRIRGSRWSLNQVAAEAGVSRGITRAALAEGWLPDCGPYAETDIVLLRFADAWMRVFPDHKGPASSSLADTAQKLTSAAVLDPRSPASTVVVASPVQVRTLPDSSALAPSVQAAAEHLVVVFPVGAWRATLPSQRRYELLSDPSPAFPTRTGAREPRHTPDVEVSAEEQVSRLSTPPPSPLPAPPTAPAQTPKRPESSPTPEGMTAYQAFTHARDAIVSRAHSDRPTPYDSPGEPW